MRPSASLWHSRIKLATSVVFLACVSLLIDYRSGMDNAIVEETKEESVNDAVRRALESMRYMHDLQRGKAEVKEVVERTRPVVEHYWWCSVEAARDVRERGWVEHDGLHLYSAYYDMRHNSLFPGQHAIQVLMMTYRSHPSSTVYCNLRTARGRQTVVEGVVREIWQRAWDPRDEFLIPALVTCPVPRRMRDELGYDVALTRRACESSPVALRVQLGDDVNEEERRGVAVCVKGMDFREDISVRMVEWLETQLLLGADRVAVYTYSIAPQTQKVLDAFRERGAEQIPIDLPGESPSIPEVRSAYIWRNRQQKRRHELIPYNDCLYRHMRSHRYVLIVDTDEVIVPLKHDNWNDLLRSIEAGHEQEKISSISFRNVFKMPNVEVNETYGKHLHLLRNERRSRKTSGRGEYGKSFTSVDNVASVFNHFALHRLRGSVAGTVYAEETEGIKLHYKSTCPVESRHECAELLSDTVVDHSLDRFADRIKEMTEETMKKLGL